jgi:hypothetical protein
MNKEQIIDEAYENYSKEYEKDNSIGMCLLVKRVDGKSTYRKPNKEMFVDLCTHDKTFSEKWGLKIEERELSLEERAKWLQDNKGYDLLVGNLEHDHIREVVEEESPTKLITITYNNETIESYE